MHVFGRENNLAPSADFLSEVSQTFERLLDSEAFGQIFRLSTFCDSTRDFIRALLHLLLEGITMDGQRRTCVPTLRGCFPPQATSWPQLIERLDHFLEIVVDVEARDLAQRSEPCTVFAVCRSS